MLKFKSDTSYDVLPWRKCRKTAIVEAVQINEHFLVETLEGIMAGNPGDYLMRGVEGKLYACKGEIYTKIYEWVE